MLVEHRDPIGASANRTAGWREIALGEAEQGRFASAVTAGQRDSFRSADRQRPGAETSIAISDGRVLDREYLGLRPEAGGGEVDGERRQHFDPRLSGCAGLHGFLDLPFGEAATVPAAVLGALGLAAEQDLRLRSLGGEAAPGLVAPVLGLARGLGGQAGGAKGGIGAGSVQRPRARVRHRARRRRRPAAADDAIADWAQFDDAVHGFEQCAIMAGDQQAAAPARDPAFDGGPTFGVEIVGRFVEQQQVGLGDRQPGHADPRPLAAGQAPIGRSRAMPSRPTSASAASIVGRQRPVGGVEVRAVPSPASIRVRIDSGSWTPSASATLSPSCQSWASRSTVPVRWIVPDTGSVSPATMCSSVDLPDPLRPTRPMRSAPTDRVRSSKSGRPSGVAAER